MKLFVALIISTFFVISCGSKKKMDDSAKAGEETKTESSKEAGDASDEASASTSAGEVACMMKNDKRLIHVKGAGSGCELAYTKFGNEEVVATSMNGTEHCQKIADRIQGNLENAGFKCE